MKTNSSNECCCLLVENRLIPLFWINFIDYCDPHQMVWINSMEASSCSQWIRRSKGVSFELAFSHLEIFANRLWKNAELDEGDAIYGRIWLHSLELAQRFNCTTVADVLAGINISDKYISVSLDLFLFKCERNKWHKGQNNCYANFAHRRSAGGWLGIDQFGWSETFWRLEPANSKRKAHKLWGKGRRCAG